jgi:tRNA pseudouridine55 synthase
VGVVGQDGLVVVDKPGGMTSHDVVVRIRRLAHTRRVGHGGTLDPMATGVLVIGVERATRLLTYVIGSHKSYSATIRLGESTLTDDADGEVTARRSAADVTEQAVRDGLRAFVGDIDQAPSAFSAIKVGGVRSYARARRGEEFELPTRRVSISRLDVTGTRRAAKDAANDMFDVDIEVDCSSGTYIRAIARDLGTHCGVGGHLTALRRTAVGRFTLAEAATLDELAERASPVTIPLTEAARRCFEGRDVDAEQARILSHGGLLPPVGSAGPYAVFGPDGQVVAIVSERDGRTRAEVVLAPALTGGGG